MTGIEIAIIGMAGRFPGAGTVDELWAQLLDGVEAISRFSIDELRAAGVDEALLANPAYVRAAGVVAEGDRFDAGFFNYSPREAALIDPQQRVLLELAWAALEHAGYAPGTFDVPVGVYAGAGSPEYLVHQVLASGRDFDHQTVVANDKDFLATRIAYKLDLRGPAVVVQTACSTSLVAVHMACQALIAGECDLALAGGVTIRARQHAGYLYQEDGIASPDGHCRAFSASAQGCVPGNGGGVVVLKRLAQAIEDRDCIHAVIRGTAINNDGARKVGYTAPGANGQEQVIRAALGVADVTADSIGYLEAHGTGTLIGDPIEVEAASRAYREDTEARGYCALGSVKSNLGHLDAGAGVTGLIKAALAVRDGVIPASLHGGPANPRIGFASSPFFVNLERREWHTPDPRRAGVSAFGIGGTNAHAVLEEPPRVETGGPSPRPELLVVSAKTPEALARAADALARHLDTHAALPLEDVGHTLRQGRAHFAFRRAVVARDARDGAARLRNAQAPAAAAAPAVVFMFPGQGSQYPGMAGEVYRSHRVARDAMDRCIDIACDAGLELRAVLAAARHDEAAGEALRDTRLAQPAIFTVSYALARQLMAWGVEPAAMIGHSVGEFVAACLAGVMTLEHALMLVIERGRLMSALPRGAMAAVPLDAADVERLLPAGVALAAANGPGRCVVSGTDAAVDALLGALASRGVRATSLHTSHAFHSAMMDDAVPAFVERVASIPLRRPERRYLSNVTGTWITAAEATDPSYYGRHLRAAVRFSDGLREAQRLKGTFFVEVGPGTALTTFARRHGFEPVPGVAATLPHPDDPTSDAETLLEALGAAWCAGVDVAWPRVDSTPGARRVPLPSYPFARDRHWIDVAVHAPAVVRQPDIADWFSVPSWERVPPVAVRSDGAWRAQLTQPAELWLVLVDRLGFGADLARSLRERGAEVVAVEAGASFDVDGDTWTMAVDRPNEYQQLASLLALRDRPHLRVVHCWTLDADADVHRGVAHLPGVYARGFDSLLFLAQALGDQAWLSSCHLSVVTSQVHDVIGTERLWPEKATVLGPCRTIPLEYPLIECVSIDIDAAAGGARDRARLADMLRETVFDPPGETLAIRGRHRWRQVERPCPVAPAAQLHGFVRGGTYLITGGLKGVGLVVAGHLARTLRANLVLVGRTPLPPRAEWRVGGVAQPWTDTALARMDRAQAHIFGDPAGQPPALDSGWTRGLDRLCAAYAWQFLMQAGADAGDASWDRERLRERRGVLPRFGRYVDALVAMLVDEGLAEVDGGTIRFAAHRPEPSAEELLTALREAYPSMRPLLDVLDACARSLDQTLTGGVPSIEPLFGDGRYDAFQAAVATVRAHSFVPACERFVGELLAQLPARDDRPLRILEIGGGEGVLTRALLPRLEGRRVAYHFTDIGRSFVLNAQRRAAGEGQSFLRADVLDITRPPSAQGFEAGGYDVVLAFNVLHATPDVVASLAHARELLAPGGLLVLQESVRPARWIDVIWGLTDGWWAFADTARRTTSPLLGLDAWTAAVRDAGFDRPASYPRDAGDRVRTDTGVVIGVAPGFAASAADGSVAAAIQAVQRIEALGSEVEIVTADVADVDAMATAIAAAERRWGRLDGIVHAALVLNDGAIQTKTPEAAAAVFRPKIDGTLALKTALAGRRLDVFVLFSSLVSTISGPGQVDYCAASAFQDAFAHAEQGRLAGRVLAVDWAAWREVGKAFRAAVERGASPSDALPNGMSPAEGCDALARGLASGAPQIIVSPEPLDAVRRSRRDGSMAARSTGPVAATAVDTRPETPSVMATEPAATDLERLIAGLWRDVLGVADVGAADNFFDLGGDSVMSLQFIAQARKAGLRLTNKQVFEHQTVAALAAVAVRIEPREGGVPA